MVRWKKRIYALTLVVALGVLWTTVGRRLFAPAVPVVGLEKRAITETIVASGRVLAPAKVNLGVLVLGAVTHIAVREGDAVTRGQLLLQLDDAEARAAVTQASAQVERAAARVGQVERVDRRLSGESLKQAEANLKRAEQAFERTKTLAERGAATPAELDDATRALEVARSQRDAARASQENDAPAGSDERLARAALREAEGALAAAKARLERTRIVAPSDAIVLERRAEVGDVVQAGQVLLVLAQKGDTELLVEPDEKNLARLALGQPALASPDAFPAVRFAAKVSFIAPAVDPDRGTIDVKLAVAEPPKELRPELTVSVEIEVGKKADAATLPFDALREPRSASPWVLVVKDGVAERRDVELGLTSDRYVEIAGGLAAGDRVIAPAAGVEPGARVKAREGR